MPLNLSSGGADQHYPVFFHAKAVINDRVPFKLGIEVGLAKLDGTGGLAVISRSLGKYP